MDINEFNNFEEQHRTKLTLIF